MLEPPLFIGTYFDLQGGPRPGNLLHRNCVMVEIEKLLHKD